MNQMRYKYITWEATFLVWKTWQPLLKDHTSCLTRMVSLFINLILPITWLTDCLGLMSLLNIWGHIATVPTCSIGTLINVVPHMNSMPQTQDMTPHPVTLYRHRVDMALCATHWNTQLPILKSWVRTDREILPRPSTHTSERISTICYQYGGSQSEAR